MELWIIIYPTTRLNSKLGVMRNISFKLVKCKTEELLWQLLKNFFWVLFTLTVLNALQIDYVEGDFKAYFIYKL